MKRSIFFALFVGLFFTSSAFASEASCTAFANSMMQRAVAVFHDSKKSEEQKRQALYTLFYEAVDTDWIGKFVLGHFWREATLAQQKEYLEAYRTYMSHTYISKMNEDDFENITAIDIVAIMPRPAGQFEAKTLVKQKDDDDVSVHYTLDDTSGKCRIHDIKVEGVSLVTGQRSEFSTLAQSAGVSGVIAALHKQIENIQSGN